MGNEGERIRQKVIELKNGPRLRGLWKALKKLGLSRVTLFF